MLLFFLVGLTYVQIMALIGVVMIRDNQPRKQVRLLIYKIHTLVMRNKR